MQAAVLFLCLHVDQSAEVELKLLHRPVPSFGVEPAIELECAGEGFPQRLSFAALDYSSSGESVDDDVVVVEYEPLFKRSVDQSLPHLSLPRVAQTNLTLDDLEGWEKRENRAPSNIRCAVDRCDSMIRVVAAVIGFAILVSLLSGGNKYAIWAALALAAVGVGAPLLMGTSALKCPHCRKRVKLGAGVCHHCGSAVGRVQ